LEYRFPSYTGLSPRVIEEGGDVAALKGTEVRLRVTPTVKTGAARLLVQGEELEALAAREDGTLTGAFTVSREGLYSIEFQRLTGGRFQRGSPDYVIDVLPDQPPLVSLAKPGRDTLATPVEEVFTEATAEDDYGVGRLELVYSVNGEAEQSLDLHRGRPLPFVSGGHTFFLEELGLQPGDFLSYYARARDAAGQSAATDIYFLEVRPFEREYRRAEDGGASGGNQGQSEGRLSDQQRQIVAATFRLVRDGDRYPAKEMAQNLGALALLQGRLQEQVDSLSSRMGNRGATAPGSAFLKAAASLRSASEEMRPAREALEQRRPRSALAPEQGALRHLQRAEALFRDVEVSLRASGGGEGSSDGLRAEDLADLLDLELDKLRNQYETVQRGERRKLDQDVDEAIARLRELARRQQQEVERQKRLAQGLPRSPSDGAGSSQRELAKEAEELGRKLERLARERRSPSLEETARRLQAAANAMRRAGGEGSGSQGIAALDRLREARRRLEGDRSERLGREMEEAVRRAGELETA
ncbi:MAG TPA: DUF4175 family protein, partial [Vicinamibacteria bacterium]